MSEPPSSADPVPADPIPADPIPADAPRPGDPPPGQREARQAYWKKNRRLIAALLGVWALVSYGFALLIPLDFEIGQLPANFWWAQQGSIFVFVGLIFFYAWRMDRIDEEFDVQERDEDGETDSLAGSVADSATDSATDPAGGAR